MKSITTVLRYIFREHTCYNLIFTVVGAYFIASFGVASFFYVFWIKVFGNLMITVFWYLTKRRFLYFFYNLGVRLYQLIIFLILLDGLISLIVFTVTYYLLN